MRAIANAIFFGNYFYGVCAVALAVEATLQQGYPLASPWFYAALFALPIWYYVIPYATDSTTITSNERSNWYVRHQMLVTISQWVLLILCFILCAYAAVKFWNELVHITLLQFALGIIFPIAALCYYGINYKQIKGYALRRIGWIKPFVIGFTWAGLVTAYPILFHNITHGSPMDMSYAGWLLFIKNFMYISLLCIMFDVKDYADDYRHRLKTFVVANGLRKTIFYLLIPLSIAGLISFLVYATSHHFSAMRIVFNIIPFLFIMWVGYSLRKRKSLLYYLVWIDGAMLVKGVCGILAASLF